jgi:hypothetical protein
MRDPAVVWGLAPDITILLRPSTPATMAAPSSVANRCVPGKPYRHTRARSRHESRPPSASFEHACATQLLEMSHAFLAQGHSSEKLWVHRDGRRYCLPRLARDLCDKKPHESDQPSEWDVSVQAVVCAWPRMSGEALLPGRPSPWDTGDGVMFVGWPGKVQGPGVMPLEWDLRWFEPGQFSHALELTTVRLVANDVGWTSAADQDSSLKPAASTSCEWTRSRFICAV